jgi:hypothetical protein
MSQEAVNNPFTVLVLEGNSVVFGPEVVVAKDEEVAKLSVVQKLGEVDLNNVRIMVRPF